MEYQKNGKVKGNSHGKYFPFYKYWLQKKREYYLTHTNEENKYDEYDYDYVMGIRKNENFYTLKNI